MSGYKDGLPLSRAEDLLGFAPDQIRRWAREDGWALRPAAISKKDLRNSLRARDLPVPPALEVWPRVLIADDDPDVLQIVMWLVEQVYPDAEVLTAADGRRAAELLEDLHPDLLITDLRMPKLDGVALCRRVNEDPELSRTKILAVSGHDNPKTREAFFSTGAVEFFGKPFDPRLMRSAVGRLLGPGPEAPISLKRV